ncbi:MAG: phosphoglucomutase [Desulfobulbaceae bacterium]|nr:phosphoglucomutase [Desulfobulbaceae bacterium]
MSCASTAASLKQQYTVENSHADSNYFALIKELVRQRNAHPQGSDDFLAWQHHIDEVYTLVADELQHNQGKPCAAVKFGTSGWRGTIGKDLFVKSIALVTRAIVAMYEELDNGSPLSAALGVKSLAEARERGCVIGHDNRFGGDLLARTATDVLTSHGFTVHFAGEATTGTLSAALLIHQAAFSINLTPSHNPMEYAGFKFNAADGGPAASELTNRITERARQLIDQDRPLDLRPAPQLVKQMDALAAWVELVRRGQSRHGLDYPQIMARFAEADNLVVAVDCVHGASRVHVRDLFRNMVSPRLLFLRDNADPTFGGVAPEPSTANMRAVTDILKSRPEPLKLGIIMDPDADRVRFTDGTTEIDMNTFGAMAYHFLHEVKGKRGLVAKTVATSNFANRLAEAFGEEVFEPRVGFKEFKPVIDRALICFEESDGITAIGHTPEKDAYIGLLLAMDMALTLQKNLGDYRRELRETYGYFYPDRDGVTVSQQGGELTATLARLEKYAVGATVPVGGEEKQIAKVIDIDGRKMILADGSWLMVRPSGTEPKVRFYVEARTEAGKDGLFAAAKAMLAEIGLLS